MLSNLGKGADEKPCNTIDTLIGEKTELKGDITFTGGLRIDGKVKGHITAKDGGNGTLVLSENAVVVGNITVPHVIINGKIQGNVRASGHIELQASAEITGDVYYQMIEMAMGAVINGNLVREAAEADKDKGAVTRLKPVAGSGVDADS